MGEARKFGRNGALNLAGGFLIAHGFVATACLIGLQAFWLSTAPHLPAPAHGHVFAHREHGVLSYYSAFQSNSYALLLLTSIPLAVVGMGISPKGALRRRGGKMKWDHDDPAGWHPIGLRAGFAASPILIFLLGPALVNLLDAAGLVLAF